MASRDDFRKHLWANRINDYMQEDWIDKEIALSQTPEAPFADIGPVLKRIHDYWCYPSRIKLIARVGEYN